MHASDTAEFALAGIADFELTDAQFHRIRALVREHTGIALSDAKRQLVYGRLSRRLRALKLGSFREYIELLERGVATELEEFINAITTNLTSFFREPHHFEYLATDVLPQIVARDTGVRRARIWCCAASTGEEPYSIAHGAARSGRCSTASTSRCSPPTSTPRCLRPAPTGVYNAERLTVGETARVPRASSTRAAARRPANFACRTSCAT